MLKSMTAFVSKTISGTWGSLTWELRSVNHRYLDVNFKLGEGFKELEPQLRHILAGQIHRGKMDVCIKYQLSAENAAEYTLNTGLARSLIAKSQELAALGAANHVPDPMAILAFPGMLRAETPDLSSLHDDAIAAFSAACEQLSQVRAEEGSKLAALVQDRIDQLHEQVLPLYELQEQAVTNYKQRMHERFAAAQLQLDSDRLEQELVLFTQKMDFSEELDRLKTHIAAVTEALQQGSPSGRRLDFLMQELNREVNTLGSKAAASQLDLKIVDLKVLIEQMREQIQNIE